jgi:uncharacterized protein
LPNYLGLMAPPDPIDPALIASAEAFVRRRLEDRACGHDWWHIHRVRALAHRIALTVGADPGLTALAALLHDVADPKLETHPGEGKEALAAWLDGTGLAAATRARLEDILSRVSFSRELDAARGEGKPPELMAVQDADRLDALGAVGIARAFAYGGSRGQAIHDPGLPPREGLDGKAYRSGRSTGINHFHEKLLRLKGLMNTEAGRALAEGRHRHMEDFLERFAKEWDGEA